MLLLIHTGLLTYSAYVHSPTLNEPGHLVAGLSHWKFGRFELYRVNPPLVRMVAALPVMAVGYEEDWSGFYEGPGARPVFGMGEDFVAANGDRSFFLFMIARWACIPFSWIGGIVCYLWARDLYGRPAGVMACTLWCFSPNILAHASLITADAGGTALGVAACYTFWQWLKKPTWTQAALTGVVLGLAELAKTT
ncbi:MAG: glycosyltransferase family 39 protein, partial [Pirellulales bacterium]|nr:glycosyltransferase family 39 protein [Pirellulales bacterium]